jgi:hypothetical protein
MLKVYFQLLCDKIKDIVEPDQFTSEVYVNNMLCPFTAANHCARNINVAHNSSTGGIIPGEVKLALTLWVLGGDVHGHDNDI